MDWKKLGYVFAASFVVSGLTVACALAPILSDRAEIIGFWGSIAGGMVGGAMTLAAGWLAWTAAQRQIAAQLAVLELATDEHLKKSVRALNEVEMIAVQIAVVAGETLRKRSVLAVDPLSASQPMDGNLDWQGALSNPEFWRIDFSLADDIRRAQTAVLTYNKGNSVIAAILGRPRWVRADLMRIQSEALDLAKRCRAEARRLELMSHSATRPAERPAQ